MEKVKDAFSVLKQTGEARDTISYDIWCVPKTSCPPKEFASTDPQPETFAGGRTKPGRRVILICPKFFEDKVTKQRLPTNAEEKEEEYCKKHERKKLGKFETGGMLQLPRDMNT
jgi:hypothetical protein